ncbi:MAG: YIP1 family protein [Methanoregula sp.]
MFSGIRNLLIHPNLFFERVSKEKVNLVPPVIIIGIGLLALIIGKAIPVFWVSAHFPSFFESSGGLSVVLIGLIFCHTIIPLLTWSVMILGSYGISRFLNGKGSLAVTVQNTGYGFLPWTFFTIASLISSSIIFVIFHAWALPSGNSIWGYWIFWIAAFFGIVFFSWQWYLWVLAVKYTHGFTFRKAAAVTIIPVVIIIWLTIPVQVWINTIAMTISGT